MFPRQLEQFRNSFRSSSTSRDGHDTIACQTWCCPYLEARGTCHPAANDTSPGADRSSTMPHATEKTSVPPKIHISWCQLVSGVWTPLWPCRCIKTQVQELSCLDLLFVKPLRKRGSALPVHRRQWDLDQPFTILLAFLGGILSLLRSEVSRNQTETKRLYNIRSSYCNSFRAALRNEDDGGMNGWIDGQVHNRYMMMYICNQVEPNTRPREEGERNHVYKCWT